MGFDFFGFETVLNQEREVAEKRQSYRPDAVKTVQDLVANFHFTAEELGIAVTAEAPAAEKPRRVMPPKYCTPDGFTWTGRGRQPKAIAEAIAAGHTLESMRI